LLLDQIDRQRPQSWPILRATRRLGGEGASSDVLTGWTAHMERLVFPDVQAHDRQVMQLAAFVRDDRGVSQRRLAVRADLWPQLDDFVRSCHQSQRLATMPQLSTGLLAAFLAQTPRLACKAVAAGRFAAVVAILR
jgi:hypothetical protein